MSETGKASISKMDTAENQHRKDELAVAFVEHGIRPIAYVLIAIFALIFLFSLKTPLVSLLDRSSQRSHSGG